MLDVNYPAIAIAKAHAIAERAQELPVKERDDFCQKVCNLSYKYLAKIGIYHHKPSSRTLMNLGYELIVRDLATGETETLEMNIPCDWNPQNPRMNPTSSKVFVPESATTSTSSE